MVFLEFTDSTTSRQAEPPPFLALARNRERRTVPIAWAHWVRRLTGGPSSNPESSTAGAERFASGNLVAVLPSLPCTRRSYYRRCGVNPPGLE
jgi:hypothetical protein